MTLRELDTSDTPSGSTHGANRRFRKANHLALAGKQHDVLTAIGNRRPNQHVVIVELIARRPTLR